MEATGYSAAAYRPSTTALRRLERLEEALRHACPRPLLLGHPPGRRTQSATSLRRQGEQLVELVREVERVAGLEAGQVTELSRVSVLEADRDLLQAGMTGDEGRSARGRGLGRDHAERLGEDRRDDRYVGERDE